MNVKNKFTISKVLKISLLCFASMTMIALFPSMDMPQDPLVKQQAHLAARAIGDDLLSDADDHRSPVQPVQAIDAQTLRLSFEAPISINPDSLSWLAVKHIDAAIAARAIVTVRDAVSGEIVYGFEINPITPKEIPCLGRSLPKSDYYVDISFYAPSARLLGLNAFTLSLIGFTFVSFVLMGMSSSFANLSKSSNTPQSKGIQLDPDSNQILSKDIKIKLTNKEAQIFSLLLKQEGRLVSRAYLTQEVWLKEGVITSRSLDMYISRLRKKLKDLPHVEIVNQHGKGYVLKVYQSR